ncbi:bacillithiol biosynthesis cysteine-adding enzyme BshC [Flagellimonas sp. DF-77]|uniref:bacillithiol biosynthesis cysteine-adding enzyme BshC n=1 Tax=Flagellimonas algarum TaxID=3230298 RepID=UPI00339828BF
MQADYIAFRDTGYFSSLICDYLDEAEALGPFYGHFPTLDAFKDQIAAKSKSFPKANRTVLKSALEAQYAHTVASKRTKQHIASLEKDTTFTIVTGHQLNLFTGPLYFLYKIISTIRLTQALKKQYPKNDFVPIYWMATEDHDFDEINYFNFGGRKVQWNREAGGAVGRFDTAGLDAVLQVMKTQFGQSTHAKQLLTLFEDSYLKHKTLAAATRYLANALFGAHGLVIVDGDDKVLKELLAPHAAKDIFEQLPYQVVGATNAELTQLDDRYSIQVNPREINYFYLKDSIRERIVAVENHFEVMNTGLRFTEKELRRELDEHPERFSPNVIARPLYQEVILPNLCYIGGGGELAYWLQLKDYFEAMDVVFPMLLLRNSALIISEKQQGKLEKMGLEIKDLFLDANSLINKKIRQISNIDIDFSPQKQQLQTQFKGLYDLAKETDASFLGAVKAQERKQVKGLEALEKRLLKAQKRKLKDQVARITSLQNELFPNRSLQERQLNFSEVYLQYGAALIDDLFENLDPLRPEFTLLRH